MWDKTHVHHLGIARRYGNLFQQYEPKYWYWECIEMVRKLLLTGGMVLVADGKCSFRLDDTCWWYSFFKTLKHILVELWGVAYEPVGIWFYW